MIIAQIESQIRYVTNADGETTDVLVPVEPVEPALETTIFKMEKQQMYSSL